MSTKKNDRIFLAILMVGLLLWGYAVWSATGPLSVVTHRNGEICMACVHTTGHTAYVNWRE